MKDAKFIETNCGGEPVFILKNPSEVYQHFAKNYETSIKGAINILDTFKISSDIQLSQDIKMLRVRLNQESIRNQDALKANYLAFWSKPCDDVVYNKFISFLKSLTDKQIMLDSLKMSFIYGQKGNNKAINNEIKHFNKKYFKEDDIKKFSIPIRSVRKSRKSYMGKLKCVIKQNNKVIFKTIFNPNDKSTLEVQAYSEYDLDMTFTDDEDNDFVINNISLPINNPISIEFN